MNDVLFKKFACALAELDIARFALTSRNDAETAIEFIDHAKKGFEGFIQDKIFWKIDE